MFVVIFIFLWASIVFLIDEEDYKRKSIPFSPWGRLKNIFIDPILRRNFLYYVLYHFTAKTMENRTRLLSYNENIMPQTGAFVPPF